MSTFRLQLREDRPATIEEHRALRAELVIAGGKIAELMDEIARLQSIIAGITPASDVDPTAGLAP